MRKKMWFFVGAIALLMPTIVLCLLFMTSDEMSLPDFAASERFIISSENGSSEVVLEGDCDEYHLLRGFLLVAEQSKNSVPISDIHTWHYTVGIPGERSRAKIGFIDGMCIIGWRGKAYLLDYPLLSIAERTLLPGIVRYGLKTDDGYVDAPKLEQNTAFVYCTDSQEDLRRMACGTENGQVQICVLLYKDGAEEETARFCSFDEISLDPTLSYSVFVNTECVMQGYRVQCSYEIRYIPLDS